MKREGELIAAPLAKAFEPTELNASISPDPPGEPNRVGGDTSRPGILIMNADDWGRNKDTTDRIFDCVARKTVSSVSAMVFMEDSERAAVIAGERSVDAGLHLNFTTEFSVPGCPDRLKMHQRKTAEYLLRNRLVQVVFHPGLVGSFEYVAAAQLDEFRRIYQRNPTRLDGHHHTHLSANVLLGRLLPEGTIVRRNFSFQRGEKSLVNRLYRKAVDRGLARRHHLTDYFFSLPPFEPQSHLERIRSLAQESVVEVETHPVNADEYRFLTGDGVVRWTLDVPIAPRFSVRHWNREVTEGKKP